jgi:hypothetical protein
MKRHFPVLIIFILFLFSCNKEQQGYPYQYNVVADYTPTSIGSTWKYGISYGEDPSNYIDSITVTMTTNHLNMGGKAFAVAAASSPEFEGFGNFYFYESAGKYKVYSTILTDMYSGTQFAVPFMLNGAVLNRDTTIYIPNADPSKPPAWTIQTYTNSEYQDVEIRNKVYTNCISSDVTIEKLYDGTDPQYTGQYQVYDTYQFMSAPNVGIIQEVCGYNDEVLTLLSSNIKQ